MHVSGTAKAVILLVAALSIGIGGGLWMADRPNDHPVVVNAPIGVSPSAAGTAGSGPEGTVEAQDTNQRPAERPRGALPTVTAAPFEDPEVAARAYLQAAESATSADAQQLHRRAEPLQAPDNPERGFGIFVEDPPPAGSQRTVRITGVEVWGGSVTVGQVTYQMTYDRLLDGTKEDLRPSTTYLVLKKYPDFGWLVKEHQADMPLAIDNEERTDDPT